MQIQSGINGLSHAERVKKGGAGLSAPVASPPRFTGDAYSPLNQGAIRELTDQVRRLGWDVKNLLFHHNGPNTRVQDAVFTVFDLETTGLDPKADGITEICAIKFRNGRVIDRFTTLVNPGRPIPEFIQQKTNITPWMLRNAPDMKTALRDLARFVGENPVLVGHYVNFDIEMVRAKLTETGLNKYRNRFWQEKAFCTKTLGQLVIPGLPSYSGVPLGEYLGVRNNTPHRAESDVMTTGGTFYKLWHRIKTDVETLMDLTRYQGGIIRDYSAKPPRLNEKNTP